MALRSVSTSLRLEDGAVKAFRCLLSLHSWERVSSDDGASWDAPRRLTDAARKPYRINDEPSIALTGPTHRVSFDRYERTFRRYDVWLRSST